MAERLGYDPREARFEFEDIKRQREQFQRERREWEEEARRNRERFQPQIEFQTPGEKALFDIVNEMREERRQEREERLHQQRQAQEVEEQATAIRQAAEATLAQAGIKPEEMDVRVPEFLRAMEELYPEGIPGRLGAYGAARNTIRFWNNSRNGTPGPTTGYRPRPSQREIVIPAGTVRTGMSDENDPKRRPGETTEQWVMRLRKMSEESGPPPKIPEGQHIIIE